MKNKTTYYPTKNLEVRGEGPGVRGQMSEVRGGGREVRGQERGAEGEKQAIQTKKSKTTLTNNKQQTTPQQSNNPILLLTLLLTLFYACSSQETTFEPRRFNETNTENLNQYLDTKNILNQINQLTSTKEKVDSLLYYTDLLKNYNEDAALQYAEEANLIATEKNLKLSKAISFYYMALFKGRMERFGEGIEEALVDARYSLQIFKDLSIPYWEIELHDLIGIFHYRQLKYDSAQIYLKKALQLIESKPVLVKDSLILIGELFHDFAIIYERTDSSKALEYYYKGLETYEQTKNVSSKSRLRLDLAAFFSKKNQFEKADSLIRESIDYAKTNKDTSHLIDGLQGFGFNKFNEYRYQYQDEEDNFLFDEAMKTLKECIPLQKENLYYTYHQIGNMFQARAFHTKNTSDVDSAIIYYKKSMLESRKEGVLPVMKAMSQNISVLCDWLLKSKKRDCTELLGKQTYAFLNDNYTGTVDTVYAFLQTANQRLRKVERKEQEVINKTRIKNQWFISGTSLVFAVLIFVLILLWQQQKRLKAKMAALRAQINPHFISNSLNAIESLVNLDKKEAASKYLIRFSRLSRRILNSSVDAVTSLDYELQTLDHFLALEKLRFRDKLNYDIQVSPGLNKKMIQVPAMILQPFVENAIWHGIKPKQGPGLLQVNVERNGKLLVCTIEDDGIGRKQAAQLKSASLLSQQKSHGMKITKDRLHLLGKAKGAKVEIIDLLDTEGKALGTRVVIRIPFKLKKEQTV